MPPQSNHTLSLSFFPVIFPRPPTRLPVVFIFRPLLPLQSRTQQTNHAERMLQRRADAAGEDERLEEARLEMESCDEGSEQRAQFEAHYHELLQNQQSGYDDESDFDDDEDAEDDGSGYDDE